MNPYDDPNGDGFGPEEDFGTDMIMMDPPGRQRWRSARPIAAAGVAIVALAGGAGVGFAAAHSTAKPAVGTSAVSAGATPTPSAFSPGSRAGLGQYGSGPRFPFPPFFAGPDEPGAAGGVVHGEFTVPKSGGGYEILDMQSGTVTAVSATSVTVKSSDGYSLTYKTTSKTLVDGQAAGIGSIKKGDSALVTATVSGSTRTAADIFEPWLGSWDR